MSQKVHIWRILPDKNKKEYLNSIGGWGSFKKRLIFTTISEARETLNILNSAPRTKEWKIKIEIEKR